MKGSPTRRTEGRVELTCLTVPCCRYPTDWGKHTSVQYAPSAPAVEISQAIAANRVFWFRLPEDWYDAAHPSPRQQVFRVLDDDVVASSSNRPTIPLKAGDRLLMGDTTSKDHTAKPVRGEYLAVVIALECAVWTNTASTHRNTLLA